MDLILPISCDITIGWEWLGYGALMMVICKGL